MANPKPLPAPAESLYKPKWKTGQTKTIRVPVAISEAVMAIAHCIDADPTIAAQLLEYAQSLVEQSTK